MRPRFLFSLRTILLILGAASFLSLRTAWATQAQDWKLTDLNGKSVQLSDYRGKVVILDFWATWCPPCRDEIPNFVDLQKEYGPKGLVVLGVSMDDDAPKVVPAFVQKAKINYPILFGTEDVGASYGVQGLPTTFVISPKGQIVDKHEAYTSKTVFEDEIKKLLPGIS